MTQTEVLKLALEALEEHGWPYIRHEKPYNKAITALREALAEQPAQQQEPVAFYVYKPTLPRGNLGLVADGDLPWVYDQDPSSGFSARMLVTPVISPPAQRKPLSAEEIEQLCYDTDSKVADNPQTWKWTEGFARAIEAAHQIYEDKK